MNQVLAERIKAISNVFEISRPQPDYGYVEKLNDGRGYTVTNYGFCTSTGEVSTIIRSYSIAVPKNPLRRFLTVMRRAPDKLPGDDFPVVWREEAKTSDRLGIVCERLANRLYLNPSLRAARIAGIRTPVGKSVFYDTWLQHGGGRDPDSFYAIYFRTRRSVGDLRHCKEPDFLRAFLAIRKAILLNPSDPSTAYVWQQSAPRIDALVKLVDENPDLIPPITVANAEITAIVE